MFDVVGVVDRAVASETDSQVDDEHRQDGQRHNFANPEPAQSGRFLHAWIMAEVAREPGAEVLILAADALGSDMWTAVDTRGADGLAKFGQEAVGPEAAHCHGIES